MIKSKKDGLLIIISGPSGAGKGTVIKELLKDNKDIWESVSMVTRPPREGEVEGVNYFFVTKEEFERRIKEGKMLEYEEVYSGIYYGTPKDELLKRINNGEDVLLEVDIKGAINIKELMPDAICIFIMPPSMKELRNRLESRGTETKERVLERFKKAYKEINEVTKYNYVVVNDDVMLAKKKIESILISEKCRVDRIEDVELGNMEEEIHELLTN